MLLLLSPFTLDLSFRESIEWLISYVFQNIYFYIFSLMYLYRRRISPYHSCVKKLLCNRNMKFDYYFCSTWPLNSLLCVDLRCLFPQMHELQKKISDLLYVTAFPWDDTICSLIMFIPSDFHRIFIEGPGLDCPLIYCLQVEMIVL